LKELAIVVMAHERINIEWLKELRKQINADFLAVVDAPKNTRFKHYCEHYLINAQALGFGKARRVSMLLGSEFGRYCIVTDGDGQYPAESVFQVSEELLGRKWEIVIPQRINRKLFVRYQNKILDRTQFELLENLCALSLVPDQNFSPDFDVQPGMIAFKSSIVRRILPNDIEWLADLEVIVNAIRRTRYHPLPVIISPEAQGRSTFSWDAQVRKFMRLSDYLGSDLKEIYDKNYSLFKNPEKQIIEKILKSLTGRKL